MNRKGIEIAALNFV